jgi:hypothetical protein
LSEDDGIKILSGLLDGRFDEQAAGSDEFARVHLIATAHRPGN